MRNMSHDVLDMLREIEAHYRAKGASSPQNEIASALGVNQSAVSKWLAMKVRPDRHAAKIMALYHDVTGKNLELPVVSPQIDDQIRLVIEAMLRMSEKQREILVNMAGGLVDLQQSDQS